ncbi:MAG: hypothetical protein HFE45_07880 [Oscillospiraceae bacterium]|nr:hypothetical protein [Oscillospiraceae bacterium]
MPYSSKGAEGYELAPMENCPIQVKKERLTLKVTEQVKDIYQLPCDITAAYSLYNPTSSAQTLSVVFPIVLPDQTRTDAASLQKILQNSSILFKNKPVPFQSRTLKRGSAAEAALADGLLERFGNFKGPSHSQGVSPYILLLDFTIDFEPDETAELRVCTTMTAYMERSVIFNYYTTNKTYTFYYLFSPAQYWGSFEDLTVDLRISAAAPYLTASTPKLWWAGPRRYLYKSAALPKSDLRFTVIIPSWVYPLRLVGVIILAAAAIRALLWIRQKLWKH